MHGSSAAMASASDARPVAMQRYMDRPRTHDVERTNARQQGAQEGSAHIPALALTCNACQPGGLPARSVLRGVAVGHDQSRDTMVFKNFKKMVYGTPPLLCFWSSRAHRQVGRTDARQQDAPRAAGAALGPKKLFVFPCARLAERRASCAASVAQPGEVCVRRVCKG